jgi:Right handed beta helix region
VISSNTFSGNPVYGGIDLQGSAGSVSNNRVITHPAPPGASPGVGIAFASNTVVSGNTVENWGVWGLGDSNVIKGNMVSQSSITASGSNNLVQHNLLFNGGGINLSCGGTSNNVTYNIINDVEDGITGVNGGDVVTPNSFSNVAVVSSQCG